MQKALFSLCCFWIIIASSNAQGGCINVDPIACHFECLPVTYSGPAPANATYLWSSNCGAFANPNQQNPGNLCFLFLGTCIIQVIVNEVGMDPDTCTAEVIVFPNPDGLLEGDTTICSGDCTPLHLQFLNGTTPFGYQIDDGINTSLYTSSGSLDTVIICPPFFTTYTLVSITDGFGCTSTGPFNAVDVNVVPGISASITQTGNQLCANPPNQNYLWWNCDYTQLQSISQCINLVEHECYCLIVSDGVSDCVDTVCGDFIVPCSLECSLTTLSDSVCIGENIHVDYTGNASDTATLNWIVTQGNGSQLLFSDSTSIDFPATEAGCVIIALIVVDGSCQTICRDTICTYSHLLFAALQEDLTICDSCTMVPISLDGHPPFTLYVASNGVLDTISGITDSVYLYSFCMPLNQSGEFILLDVTDSVSSCPVVLGRDTITITTFSRPVAVITQTENTLCADSVLGAYAWYDCTYTLPLSTAGCFELTQSACYCLVVTNGNCSDTICGDFIFDPCQLTCQIALVDNACIGDSVIFAYTGNASAGALFNWSIDLPGFPGSFYSGNDTIILTYAQTGCYQVALNVIDQGCISDCADSVCLSEPHSVAAICCDENKCDTCIDLSIGLSGTPPWTIYISDGLIVDTISGILSSPYLYHVCPASDSSVTYTLLGVKDTINSCPGYVTGVNTALINLHADPHASIVHQGDTLCAFPMNMTSYGWYSCAGGPFLETARCFVPETSGCYCVDVVNENNCVDTACINIILSSIEPADLFSFAVFPNPFSNELQVVFSEVPTSMVLWSLSDVLGQVIENGHLDGGDHHIVLKLRPASGIYIFSLTVGEHQTNSVRLMQR